MPTALLKLYKDKPRSLAELLKKYQPFSLFGFTTATTTATTAAAATTTTTTTTFSQEHPHNFF